MCFSYSADIKMSIKEFIMSGETLPLKNAKTITSKVLGLILFVNNCINNFINFYSIVLVLILCKVPLRTFCLNLQNRLVL